MEYRRERFPERKRNNGGCHVTHLDKINYVYSEGTAYQIQALKDVNLEIKDGQFIGVIGHTGSGNQL